MDNVCPPEVRRALETERAREDCPGSRKLHAAPRPTHRCPFQCSIEWTWTGKHGHVMAEPHQGHRVVDDVLLRPAHAQVMYRQNQSHAQQRATTARRSSVRRAALGVSVSLLTRASYRIARSGPVPPLIWKWHAARAKAAGLTDVLVIVSFDCDTDRDASVVGEVDDRLAGLGIHASYAIPGQQLERGVTSYASLASRGRELLAHGQREHSRYAGGRYESVFFYDRLSPMEIESDVRDVTRTFEELLGIRPVGFRAPHFGSLTGAQLRSLHRALAKYDYRYSSSSVPAYGLRYGITVRSENIDEIPLSGCHDAPLQLLDSYGLRIVLGGQGRLGSFRRQLVRTIELFRRNKWAGLVNTYSDPSQVHDWDDYWDAMRDIAALGVRTISYAELLELASSRG